MKQTITKSMFRDAFQAMGRTENFSYAGLGAIFDHFEELEDSCGMNIELDPIAVCCEYAEFEDGYSACDECGYDEDNDGESCLDWLNDRTTVIEFPGGIIIQSF